MVVSVVVPVTVTMTEPLVSGALWTIVTIFEGASLTMSASDSFLLETILSGPDKADSSGTILIIFSLSVSLALRVPMTVITLTVLPPASDILNCEGLRLCVVLMEPPISPVGSRLHDGRVELVLDL